MVPVSTMPAVLDRMFVFVPKRIAWLMPQNSDAGDVRVSGLQTKKRSHTQSMHMEKGDVIVRLALPHPTRRTLRRTRS